MRSQFTEQDTETFYDAEDALYQSFWDSEGSLHWGWFDQETGDNFLKACVNLNQIMAEKAAIDGSSRVLDMGSCGSTGSPRAVGNYLSAHPELVEGPMLLNRGQANNGRLLSEGSFNLMALNRIWDGGDYYGYGLATYNLDGRTYIGHGGTWQRQCGFPVRHRG